MKKNLILSVLACICALTLGTGLRAQDIIPAEQDVSQPKKEYSPYAGDHFPNTNSFYC